MDTTQRKVMLKTSLLSGDNQKEEVNINFINMGETTPTALDYGIQNQENQAKFNKVLQYLKSVDNTFFEWLEQDAANAILLANDPMKAIKTAIPNFDTSIFNGIDKGIFEV